MPPSWKHDEALSVLERSIPWHDLSQLFATILRNFLGPRD
jgi:hypothetical protein